MYVIITNIDELNNHELSFYEFDELSQSEKLNIEHTTLSIYELIQLLNNPDFMDIYNPEYNVFTLINEE